MAEGAVGTLHLLHFHTGQDPEIGRRSRTWLSTLPIGKAQFLCGIAKAIMRRARQVLAEPRS